MSGVRTFGALVVLVACLALGPAIAHAGVGAGTVVSFPDAATVGDTGLPASITLENRNSLQHAASANIVCLPGDTAPPCSPSGPGILLTPSCKEAAGGVCLTPDPDVFAVSATGAGRPGTACAGVAFSIARVSGSAFGTVRFTPLPVGQHVILPAFGSSCVIDFTFGVLKSPTGDQDTSTAGVQTAQTTENWQYSGSLGASAYASSNGTTVLPLPPPPPPPPPTPPSPPASPPASGGVLGAKPGSAKLSGKTGCQIKTFRADVKGTQIAKVVFTLDGKTILTLNKPNRNGHFSALVAPGKLGLGRHRIRARVTFATSATRPQTLSLVFVRCARGGVQPRFTG